MAEQIEIEGFDKAKEEFVNVRNEKVKKLTAFAYGEVKKFELAKSDYKMALSAAFEAEGMSKMEAKAITDVATAQYKETTEGKGLEAELFIEFSKL